MSGSAIRSYPRYGDIVFDPTVEPSGEQESVMRGKIELYKELLG